MLPALYELQRIPFTFDTKTRDLYYKCHGPDHVPLPMVRDDRLAIAVPRGRELDINTYFGNFYECYWRRYTSVTAFYLKFLLQGSIRLRLYRHSPELGGELIYESDLTGANEMIVIPLSTPDNYPTTHGRIMGYFLAKTDDVAIAEPCWCTDQPPQRKATIAATMCTYNRDKELAETLENLALLQQEHLIEEISVINHGKQDLEPRLRAMLSPEVRNMDFLLVEQENTGSAGGMARGIIEATESGKSDYLLRLDDDIRIDSEIVRRLPVLLGYIKDKYGIGGHMLDGLRQKNMYEAGAILEPEQIGFRNAAPNVDICSNQGLDHFARVDFIDYNAWWFFAVATKEIAHNFLPIPFFLYLDDIEFAIRLRKAKVESVSWPGIAVWHEPFYTKVEPYKSYYRFRNVMFTYEYHDLFHKKAALRVLTSFFSGSMLQFYYHRAWAVVRAMEDFLKGPEVMASWTGDSHRHLVAEEKLWSEPDLPRATPLPRAHLTGKPPKWRWLNPIAAVARILYDLRPVNPQSPVRGIEYWNGWHVWAAAGQDNLAVTHDRVDVYHVYRRNPRKVWELLVRFCKAWLTLRFGPAGHRDKALMDHLTTDDFWYSRLKIVKSNRPYKAEEANLRKVS